jgi:hypothetical protein
MLVNPIVNLHALCNSFVNIASCSSELIFTLHYAGSSIQNAIEQFISCIYLSFEIIALHSNPQKIYGLYDTRFKQLYLGRHSELDTGSYVLIF